MRPIKAIRSTIREFLPAPVLRFLRGIRYQLKSWPHRLRCLLNKYLRRNWLINKHDRLHLGCGQVHLPGFLNLDYRPTPATDLTHDCSDLTLFAPGTFQIVFSNAFFEHLNIEKREQCLKSIHRILKNDGALFFSGIPDMRIIARAYLDEAPGLTSEVFDLYHVYGYTHGKPELSPDFWHEQLHKSLFDPQTVKKLLDSSGFTHACVFNYCFRDEHIPLNLGFVAFKQKPEEEITLPWLTTFVRTINRDITGGTITIIQTQ